MHEGILVWIFKYGTRCIYTNEKAKVEEHINKIFEYSSGLVEYYWFEVRMFRDN